VAAQLLTTYEHQVLSVADGDPGSLTAAEARRLLQLGQKRPGFCTAGNRSVRLAQYAGLVNVEGRILEILPKVGDGELTEQSRGTFLRLLSHATDVPVFSQGAVGHDLRRQSLLDVFINAYFDALMRLVRAGLLRRYQTEEDDIGVIRGRLLIGRQISANAMRIDRLACRFDELTIDNPWNQVLKAALHHVRSWLTGIDSGRRWLELTATFDEVSMNWDAVALLKKLPFDRQVQHYQPALRWAGWILRLLSPNLRAGAEEAPELLFDMNRLFESAVASVLRRRCHGTSMRVVTQETGRHLAVLQNTNGQPMFALRPDLVLRNDGVVVGVGDTKWTRVEVNTCGWMVPSEDHAYQMQAYASVYPCDELALLYPWHAGLCGARSTSFNLPSMDGRHAQLHVVCIDVGDDKFPVACGSLESKFVKCLA
jgi:5-methylcytosine-specific restriction enzyme subunit McrC